jgi:hypothetical protein
LKHDKLIVDGAKTWDVKNAVHVARIYYETLPSFFGDERPASHELSRCSWLGAAKPVAWLRSKPPIMAKLQKLSRAELSRAPATLLIGKDFIDCVILHVTHFVRYFIAHR